MADARRLSDLELEQALRGLGSQYPYPATPNLATRVTARIVATPAISIPRRGWWTDPRRLALAAVLVLVLVGAAGLAIPGTRDAIAHFFHVQGVIVNRVPSTPSVPPATSLDLGRQTTLSDAQSAVKFTIAVPSALGSPDAIYVASGIPGGEVALAYKPRAGIPLVRQTGLGALITEFRGDLVPEFLGKEVGPGTTLTETRVNGDAAWWIAGEPHVILVQVAGSDQEERLRLAANTLVWAHQGVTYRIESGLTEAEAMRIAASLP